MTSIDSIQREIGIKYADALDKFCLDIYAKFYSIEQLKFAFRDDSKKLAEFFRDDGWHLREIVGPFVGMNRRIDMMKGSDVMGRFEFKVNYVNVPPNHI